jgi:hypothetical protein
LVYFLYKNDKKNEVLNRFLGSTKECEGFSKGIKQKKSLSEYSKHLYTIRKMGKYIKLTKILGLSRAIEGRSSPKEGLQRSQHTWN